jgi:hypothetical protein
MNMQKPSTELSILLSSTLERKDQTHRIEDLIVSINLPKYVSTVCSWLRNSSIINVFSLISTG